MNTKDEHTTFVKRMKEKINSGGAVTKDEALLLYGGPLEELCKAADEIREHFCGNRFDICTIINVRRTVNFVPNRHITIRQQRNIRYLIQRRLSVRQNIMQTMAYTGFLL